MSSPPRVATGLARVLLVDDDPATRLALKTVLRAGGYEVDTAASASEAVEKLEESEYELVLTDLRLESPEAGYRVLAHARIVDYMPATALITTYRDERPPVGPESIDQPLVIASEDLPELLSKVADLIAERVTRRVAHALRHAG